jgi:hypothetical protein
MSIALFDKLAVDHGMLLGLPFREGTGTLVLDRAKPHHLLTQHIPGGGSFAWGNLATGCPYLQFIPIGGGAADGVYLDSPAADTVDMNFTSGDYSIGGWINWGIGTSQSEIIIGRYATQVDGWDIYLNGVSNTLSHRHHHSSLGAGNLKSECYSTGWIPGSWNFFGVSRVGSSLYPVHYRNGRELDMTYDANGMLDPDTANRDLVVGCRNTKDANWYFDFMWNIRVWDRCLDGEEWKFIYDRERHWFN